MKTLILIIMAASLYVALVATQDALTSIKADKLAKQELLNRY